MCWTEMRRLIRRAINATHDNWLEINRHARTWGKAIRKDFEIQIGRSWIGKRSECMRVIQCRRARNCNRSLHFRRKIMRSSLIYLVFYFICLHPTRHTSKTGCGKVRQRYRNRLKNALCIPCKSTCVPNASSHAPVGHTSSNEKSDEKPITCT